MGDGYMGRWEALAQMFLLLSLSFYCWTVSCGMEYLLGQFGSAVPAMPPPSFWHIIPTLWGGQSKEKKKKRDAVQALLVNVQNTSVFNSVINTGLITSSKYSTIQASMKKTIPARPSTWERQYSFRITVCLFPSRIIRKQVVKYTRL